MKIPGLGTTTYPADGYTSYGVLFSSLGSFWTKVFGDRAALRGLTIGQSEELIQRYYDFVESLNALSVKQIEPFHRERWLPIKIRKSQLRLAPLKFLPSTDPDHAVFGPQPLPASSEETNNVLHYGETFQFGRGKRPVEKKYSVKIDPAISKLPVLADRIVAPAKIWTAGVDFWLKEGTLYFANNPFESEEFFHYELFADDGTPMTFTWQPEVYSYSAQEHETDLGPAAGTLVNEEELIIWAYHASVDQGTLYNNFGTLFAVSEKDPEVYKQILQNTVNLLTEGPTIQALTSLAASFIHVPLTQDPVEKVVDAYTLDNQRFVITDKRVYRADAFFNFTEAVYYTDGNPLNDAVKVGNNLPAGTPLFDAVLYYDNVAQPNWWQTKLNRLVLPGSMFIGNYDGVLIFENIASFAARGDDDKLRFTPDIINTVPGEIKFPFPPSVTLADQETFNAYISHPDRYLTVRELIEDSLTIAGLLDPLDFVFKHFLKTNTAMLRLRFQTFEQAAKFAQFFKLIKNCIPKYLYLLFDFELAFPQETAVFTVNATDGSTLSSDGSNHEGWVLVPPYNLPPWRMLFGWPEEITQAKRPFIISKLLDLVQTYTNGYGTFYQYAKGLSGTNNIPQDKIDFSLSYTDGADAGNIPNAYRLTGQIQVVQDGLVVTGSGTKFKQELSVGDLIYSHNDTHEYRKITEITTDTSLKIEAAFSGASRTIDLWVAHATPTTRNISGLVLWRL